MTSLKKVDLHDKVEKERDDALEFYMRKCSELETSVEQLKERIKRLEWSLQEQD